VTDRRFKILFFIPNLQQGGAERQILELARRLPERFQTTLCVWNDTIHYRELLGPGEPRHVLGVEKMGWASLKKLEKVLAEERPDIFHSFRDKANFWARLAVRRVPVKIVITGVRSRAMSLRHLLVEWFLSRRSDCVLTNSEGVRSELTIVARVNPSKIQVINNFIDTERFRPPTDLERADARSHYGLKDDEQMLLFPGRVGLQKHHLGFFRAIAMLKRRGELPKNLRIFLAGRERDRSYSWFVRRQTARMGLDDQIVRLGVVTNMTQLYHAADLMVLPSLWEGLPNVVLEATACGVPTVVSHAANIDGIIVHGQSGIEVPTFDMGALAQGIKKMFDATVEERRSMGIIGRAHVTEKFHPDRILAETLKLYEGLLSAKGLI